MSVKVDMNFDGFQREFEREIENLVQRAAFAFRGAIATLLTRSGKSNVKPPHNHSKAGQIPHNMTGTLARSWRSTKANREGSKYRAMVGTPVVYAAALEFGYAPNNLKKRPYIKKGINLATPRIKKLINVPAMVARAAARSAV